MNADNTDLVVAHTSSGVEALAKQVRRAHGVSAFNTVPSEALFSVFETRRKATRPARVYCGDDRGAKEVAAGLIRDVGFEPAGSRNLFEGRVLRAQDFAGGGTRAPKTSSGAGARGSEVACYLRVH